jgi:hypothetical protein
VLCFLTPLKYSGDLFRRTTSLPTVSANLDFVANNKPTATAPSQDLLPTRTADILHTFQVSTLPLPVADPPTAPLSLVVFSLLSHRFYLAHLPRATSPTSPAYVSLRHLLKTRPTFAPPPRRQSSRDRPATRTATIPHTNHSCTLSLRRDHLRTTVSPTVPSRAVCTNETAYKTPYELQLHAISQVVTAEDSTID